MDHNENVFTFDIDESFYFAEDQRVKNMLNLSIHPDITIEKSDDYLSIRGVLEVMGEYKRDDHEQEVDFKGDFTRRYITNVKDLGNDYNQFSQLIPVQITVPLYRVKNFEDITAEITKFDYEIKDKEHLFLTAELSIYGIDPSEEAKQRLDENLNNENFELDVKYETASSNIAKAEEEVAKEDKVILPNLEEDFTEIPAEELVAERKSSQAEENSESLELSPDREAEEVVEQEDDENEDREERKIQSAANFLSSLFQVDDEENYSQIRLCIVQTGDTVEKIAERFGLPSLQIIQYNELDDGELEAGELLYIPNRKRKTN